MSDFPNTETSYASYTVKNSRAPMGTIYTPKSRQFLDSFYDPGYAFGVGTDSWQMLLDEVPGNLGNLPLTKEAYFQLKQSYRDNDRENLIFPRNFRYKGPRESDKFNYFMQGCILVFTELQEVLNDELTDLDTNIVLLYDETEITNMYHVMAQLKFKEWKMLKDQDRNWI